jgi:hypothetical protein
MQSTFERNRSPLQSMISEFDKKDPSGKVGAATRDWRFRAISGDFWASWAAVVFFQ